MILDAINLMPSDCTDQYVRPTFWRALICRKRSKTIRGAAL